MIGQEGPEKLTRFLESRDLPFEMLCDPALDAYRAYGLSRGSLWQVLLAPPVIAAGIESYQEGHKVEPIVGDPMQLPGSFVISKGKVVYSHRGRYSSDLAPVADLLGAV